MKTTTRWLLIAGLAAALAACGGGLLGNQGRIRLVNADDRARRARPAHRQRGGHHRRRADDEQRLCSAQGGHLFARHPPDRQRRDAADDEHEPGRRQAPDPRRLQQRRHDGRDHPRRRGRRPRPRQGEVPRLQHGDRRRRQGRRLSDHRGAAARSTPRQRPRRRRASPGCRPRYTELASSATAYHLCVTSAGDKSDVRLEIPSFVLSEKRIVTVILARGAGGYLMNAIVLDQQGAATQALNASARARVATSVPTAGRRRGQRQPDRRRPAGAERRPLRPRSGGAGDGRGERPRRHAGRAAHRRAGRRRHRPAHRVDADDDAARRRQHAVVEHRAAGEAAPRQRPQRHDHHGDADAQQRARRQRRRRRARRRATRRCLERRPGAPRSASRRAARSTSTPTATLESNRVYSLFLLGDGSAPRATAASSFRTDERQRARQVVRSRRHRGALGPALGGERRLRADARPGASPRSASSCRRPT